MRTQLKTIIFVVLLVMNFISLNAVTPKSTTTMRVSGSDMEFPSYVHIVGVDQKEIEPMPDSLFYDIAGSIIFKVNKTKFNTNDPFIQELLNNVIPQLNFRRMILVGMEIRGAASPEGPYENNVRLSIGRQEALRTFLKERIDIEEQLTTTNIAEDYQRLLRDMEENQDPEAEIVRQAIEKYGADNPKAIKLRLERYNNGKLWTRIKSQYFPALRSARVVLHVRPLPEQPLKIGLRRITPDMLVPRYLKELPRDRFITFPTQTPELRLPRRELLSVKTNLLMDFAYMPAGYDKFCPMPNVALEYYPLHGHFTFGLSFDQPWWGDYDAHKYFQARNYQVEARYYLRDGSIEQNPVGEGAAFQGLYMQAYINNNLYSICFDANRGWMGEGLGGGIGVGYVLPLGKKEHWRLEFGAQAGYFWTQYDPYQYECPVDPNEHDNLYYYKTKLGPSLFQKRQHRFMWLGPTRVGITLSYDLLYRTRQGKRKVSLSPWEKK